MVQISHRYGMILFIASEVMFFVAWFWAYFNAALFPGRPAPGRAHRLLGGVWPPKGIETFDPWHLPLLNTLILLTSGTTVTWAHHALLDNDREGLKWGLICTDLLGALFTCVQAYEYSHAAFAFAGNIYGATFFMATGFHGAHVHHRHDLPDRLPDPRLCRALHADAPSRLRVRGLVLALRRRGVAVPVRLHLCLGRGRRCARLPAGTDRAPEHSDTERLRGRPFVFAASATLGASTRRRSCLTAAIARSADHAPASPCRCPRCGKGKLFAGFLTLRPRCEVCGLDYGFADAGDGPAVFVMLFAGFIVVGAALSSRSSISRRSGCTRCCGCR